ncbi:electron transport complex subunit RsxC [Thalassotalea aquiviva]|uniref:electron transport complex subunit RsxC n=1 Tax=Thalassotalea aquiviva TaxID=3242415 RepID=UPI00352A86CE
MESVIERIKNKHFFKFPGGIHPPEQKFLTNTKPIRQIPLPAELIIPLKQHIGVPGDVLVKPGDTVLKGQALTACSSPMTVPVHAPTSGTVIDIKMSTIAHPSGMSELCLILQPDGLETWRNRELCEDYTRLTKKQIVEKIANAGISGMGGAGFPTNVKVNTQHHVKFLIINAAECEPYITADDLLMREHSPTILNGIQILDHLLNPEMILIGIEDNKPEAIKALENATKHIAKINVCVLPTKYPTGGEKQLIQALTGNEVPTGVLPLSLGIVVQNVATAFAISEAVINDIPLIRRVVTVTGQSLKKPQNVWALLGSPIEHLVQQCGFNKDDRQRIIMGGPLMGFTLPTLKVPVVKTTNCILAPTHSEISPAEKELECIRCGQCAEVCPSSLLPQELQWFAKAKEHEKLEQLNIFDCIECGACAYVCPSQIPLVQYYRVGKAEIRFKKTQEIKAEKAKLRFEARKVRLEKEKQAREEKHKQAIAARQAAIKADPEQHQATNSAVAAALARVKAKKAAQVEDGSSDVPANDAKSRAAAAIARAKAKKSQTANDNADNEQITTNPVADEAKSRASAAIARAKAKKLAREQKAPNTAEPSTTQPTDGSEKTSDLSPSAQKKARAAAAIAKAKAKKLAKQHEDSQSVDPVENQPTDGSEKASDLSPSAQKKARAAAAIAKAKAKKLAKQHEDSQSVDSVENQPTDGSEKTSDLSPSAQKKARAAAAIAKAKAKKLEKQHAKEKATEGSPEQQIEAVVEEISPREDAPSTDDALPSPEELKKQRIAAAVAKAKAKHSTTISDDDKKHKIASAIAKAKSKKLQESE